MKKLSLLIAFCVAVCCFVGCSKPKAAAPTTEFIGPIEEEYISLNDDDLYQKLAVGDPEALRKLTAYSSVPQSRLQPGEGGIPGIESFKDPSALNLSNIFEMVHFDTNDYVVRGENNRAIIKQIAQYLEQHPELCIFIAGNCDERGTAAYNLSLGAKRSNSVRTLLVKDGANLEKMFTISYGKEKPLVLGHNPEAWAKNRRVQFKIYNTNMR